MVEIFQNITTLRMMTMGIVMHSNAVIVNILIKFVCIIKISELIDKCIFQVCEVYWQSKSSMGTEIVFTIDFIVVRSCLTFEKCKV